MNKKNTFIFLLFLMFQLGYADIRPHNLFSDHMVVQRESEIPVWGWGDPGEKVSIKASWGAKAKVKANADGTWKTTLKTPEAGGPFTITFSGKNSITISDVLSGEVWLCSGQSNMDFTFHKLTRRNSIEPQYQPLVEYLKNEIATADDELIRHIAVPEEPSLFEKKKNFEGNWTSAVAPDIKDVTAVGYFFAKELRSSLNVPIGIINCDWGGTRIQTWLSEEAYHSDEELKTYFDKERRRAKDIMAKYNKDNYVDSIYVKKFAEWKANGGTTPRPYPREFPTLDKQIPSALHNGMISTVVPFKIKGALWFQGESNTRYMDDQHEKYFTKMIESWRSEWGQGDFPFYWVQLAGYERKDDRSNYGAALVNDQMRRTMKLPNTGMAVSHDIGEAKDVHAHNKMDVAKRLSLWALSRDYDKDIPVVSGPLYKSHTVEGNKLVVQFNHTGTGLMIGAKVLLNETIEVGGALCWFEIAGDNGKWKLAKAKIVSSDKVEVWHDELERPVMVRYAWSSNPDGANLYNKEGLPAAVFSSKY
ncbi:MAG: sialate O-acetylesterase [Ekhidna sp.]